MNEIDFADEFETLIGTKRENLEQDIASFYRKMESYANNIKIYETDYGYYVVSIYLIGGIKLKLLVFFNEWQKAINKVINFDNGFTYGLNKLDDKTYLDSVDLETIIKNMKIYHLHHAKDLKKGI